MTSVFGYFFGDPADTSGCGTGEKSNKSGDVPLPLHGVCSCNSVSCFDFTIETNVVGANSNNGKITACFSSGM